MNTWHCTLYDGFNLVRRWRSPGRSEGVSISSKSMEGKPVIIAHRPKSKRKQMRTHPLVKSIDLILDEVIDTCTCPDIERSFSFLSEQLGTTQTRKTVPVALLSHDPLSLTSAEVFSRVEDYVEKSVRRPNTKIAYLRDLHCNKKTEKVTEILATAFETSSLVYLHDFETYYIVLQNYEAWDKQVITNVFESLHDLLQDANIRIGVFLEVSGDPSVFRAAMDYNIVFGLDIRESCLPSFPAIKEMVFLMLMSVQGFPILSAQLAKEVFAAPSFSDVRKMLKFHVIRHFMAAKLLEDEAFNEMYEQLRTFVTPLTCPAAKPLLRAKSGWIQAYGKLNVLLLSLQVPIETRLLSVYCCTDYREVVPIDSLHGCLERIDGEGEWAEVLARLEETNRKVGAQLQLLYMQSQQPPHKKKPHESGDVGRARDCLDLFLGSEERMETMLDQQEIEELKAAFPIFVDKNQGVIKGKQSRKDLLLNKPACEDPKFDAFKKTSLQEVIRKLFEEPLTHPEILLRDQLPAHFNMVVMDVAPSSTSLTSHPQTACPFLKSSADLSADLAKQLYYPHFYMGRTERLEKKLNPDVSIM